jgi:TRAP-type C4-dicarboxylate transport system substrate-binding protein
MGFHEVQNVMTMARASRFIASVVANEDWFAGLPSQERKWLEETIAQLSEEAWTLQEDLNKERLETILEQGGIRVVRLTEDERAAFRDASLPARQRFIELTGEKGQALIQRATSIAGN